MPANNAPWRNSQTWYANQSKAQGWGRGWGAPWQAPSAKAAQQARREEETREEMRALLAGRAPGPPAATATPGPGAASGPAPPKRTYTYKEIAQKKDAAKGLQDLGRLVQAAADEEERAILEQCRQRLQAKAKGELPPVQRKEDALLALAEANARLKRADKHLQEAQSMKLRAMEMQKAAQEELDQAERAERDAAAFASSPQPSDGSFSPEASRRLLWMIGQLGQVAVQAPDGSASIPATAFQAFLQETSNIAGCTEPIGGTSSGSGGPQGRELATGHTTPRAAGSEQELEEEAMEQDGQDDPAASPSAGRHAERLSRHGLDGEELRRALQRMIPQAKIRIRGKQPLRLRRR